MVEGEVKTRVSNPTTLVQKSRSVTLASDLIVAHKFALNTGTTVAREFL